MEPRRRPSRVDGQPRAPAGTALGGNLIKELPPSTTLMPKDLDLVEW